jgi:transcriptional regulator with XRE-family HTH domain
METDSINSVPVTEHENLGWRLRTLRLRSGKTLVDVATHAGLDVSYLSRLERDALQNAKPKPDTVNRVLNALGATLEEREAVYHLERPLLTQAEIEEAIGAVRSQIEDLFEPTALADEHWYIWYYNRSARATLGLTEAEYLKLVGEHMLTFVIDSGNPRYNRVPDAEREAVFQRRARMFRRHFASEEFDKWYERVVRRVMELPRGRELWERPEPKEPVPLTLERHLMRLVNPDGTLLNFQFQLNSLMERPRFNLVTWFPADAATRESVARFLRNPRFRYDLDRDPESLITAHSTDIYL